MRILLDTHTLIWVLAADPTLSVEATAAIEDGANQVLVSAATAWEIAIKKMGREGKVRLIHEEGNQYMVK